MLELFAFVLVFAGTAMTFVFVPTAWIEMEEHHRPVALDCPEQKRIAVVRLDAQRGVAACMGLPVKPDIVACSMWLDRKGCAKSCLPR